MPGVIGILQALEAIKVAIGSPSKEKKCIELRRYSKKRYINRLE